jgi:threonine aldolase
MTDLIDLRSDTVTRPTAAMRRAMAEAEVGDDVYREDPTVNLLEERAAALFGKEAAMFVPSGTMGNQIAVKLHTRPGTEVILEERSHIFNYEMGAAATFSGVTFRTVRGDRGQLNWDLISPAVHYRAPYYVTPTSLITLENTHNMAGGSVMPVAASNEICERAAEIGLPVHLDGARIFNASIALGVSVAEITRPLSSVMFCLSKGLGAPVGSLLLGDAAFINEGRNWRKRLGGGMRQVGILAAAGLIALEESPHKLVEDHRNAKVLAHGLAEIRGINVDLETVQTNIVIFDVSETGLSPERLTHELKGRGVLASGINAREMRMVTHCDVDRGAINRAIVATAEIIRQQERSH